MTAATEVSTCVDCATPIIGERRRCPACHDLHASRVVAAPQDDATDDATDAVTRQRVRGVNQTRRWVVALVAIEVLGIVGLALVLLVKGCTR